MDRRTFFGTLAGGLLAAPLAAEAQQTKIARVGLLEPSSLPGRSEAFRQGLRELGYVEGQSIIIERRSAEGVLDRLPDLAADLVRRKVDVIAAAAMPAAVAARNATKTIPIVMLGVGDPVGSGLVTSLASPGGNVTGTTAHGPEVVGKQIQLLKEVDPRVSRVAVLWNPANPALSGLLLKEATATAPSLGLSLEPVAARPEVLEGAFSAMTKSRVDAVVVLADIGLVFHRTRIVGLMTTRRLPAIYGNPEFTEAGGLMSYAADMLSQYRRAAAYIDKILKGSKPGDLPVEQPTKFELVINLKTAKALGLTIPPSLLQRADQVIE
jgi:putative ABC transport system substrate-binding protein